MFGKRLLTYLIDHEGDKIYYDISGDGKDFVAERQSEKEVDENEFPEEFEFGKINGEYSSIPIANEDLYKKIRKLIENKLEELGVKWESHYSL
jgi:hypothetical protein